MLSHRHNVSWFQRYNHTTELTFSWNQWYWKLRIFFISLSKTHSAKLVNAFRVEWHHRGQRICLKSKVARVLMDVGTTVVSRCKQLLNLPGPNIHLSKSWLHLNEAFQSALTYVWLTLYVRILIDMQCRVSPSTVPRSRIFLLTV
jgi:hypothetical protein